jgi:hypothetical protein
MERVKTWLNSEAADFLGTCIQNLLPVTGASVTSGDYVQK